VLEFLQSWLVNHGLAPGAADLTVRALLLAGVVALSLLADVLAKQLLLRLIRRAVGQTKTTWDDALLTHKVFDRLAHLAPAVVIYLSAPAVFAGMPDWGTFVANAALVYMIAVVVLALDAFLNAGLGIYRTFEVSRQIPIKSFVQVTKVVLYFLAGILLISIVLDKTPLYLLSGLGALTAVLILVFKDAILGFVAGVQLSANKMVAVGDWIEMPHYGADGDVVEVALTTVKVQNWDKTITTIPTYALISESFRNWRGMQQSGGRRIKRAVHLDVNSIRFCTEEDLERFAKIRYIREYIATKKEELAEYNREIDAETLVNGRHLTNVGTFRAYVDAYLRHHPAIRQDMTFLVRQLAPGAQGLPIEIYVFVADTRWAHYEAVQADIFDHILAVVPEFGLRVFQEPTGLDFKRLAEGK